MRGLTLRPAWAYAVAHLGKDLENRGRRPPKALCGRPFAVHAAGAVTPGDGPARALAGALAGVVLPEVLPTGCIVALARVAGVVTASTCVWFLGPFGWVLVDVRPLPVPVPCKGGQGPWRVPPRVVTQVYRALREPPSHNG